MSASGAGSMSSVCAPPRETRAGGRCTTPVSRSFEPTNPNFHSSLRAAAVAETRGGSGRRGGSTGSMPRQARNLPYGQRRAGRDLRRRSGASGPVRRQRVGGTEQQHVGAVGQRRPARAPARARPARAATASSRPGLRGAGVADRTDDRSSITCTPSSLPPTDARHPLARRHDRGGGDVARGQPGRLERRVPRLHAQGHVADLAELLVPDLGALLTRRTPALDELVGDARRAEELGEDRTGRRRRRPRRRRPRHRPRLRRRCPAARCARRRATTSERAADRSGRAAARRPRSAPTHRGRTPAPTAGAATRHGSRSRSSCRRTRGSVVANSNCDGRQVAAAQREPRRLDPMVVESSSKRRDRAGALAAALAHEGRDLRAVESSVRQVGGPGQDAAHGLQGTGPPG